MDSAGNLYAVSRFFVEPSSVCFGLFAGGPCAHLYRLDPNTGAVIQHIGDLQAAFVSDIEFAADGTLYGNRFVDERASGDGGLVTIDPGTAGTAAAPNIRFGPGLFGFDLENGGLSVHPATGDLWAVESLFSQTESIFRVDPSTGLAIDPRVRLGIGGVPTSNIGFDALEILPDGRFIATRGGGSSEVYEINPIPDPFSGLAEVTLIPLNLDPAISGNLNGLTRPTTPVTVVAIDIKPGSDPNCFNNDGNGVIPVAILGTADFDVNDIDPGSVTLEGLVVRAVGKSNKFLAHIDDVNMDGFDDLVVQIEDVDSAFSSGNGTATLIGKLLDDTLIVGTDSICVVP